LRFRSARVDSPYFEQPLPFRTPTTRFTFHRCLADVLPARVSAPFFEVGFSLCLGQGGRRLCAHMRAHISDSILCYSVSLNGLCANMTAIIRFESQFDFFMPYFSFTRLFEAESLPKRPIFATTTSTQALLCSPFVHSVSPSFVVSGLPRLFLNQPTKRSSGLCQRGRHNSIPMSLVIADQLTKAHRSRMCADSSAGTSGSYWLMVPAK
jgi:hypothetical protein